MDSTKPLHIHFFPLRAYGHLIPLVDMARQFARHSVISTIITTPFNASLISKTIERDAQLGLQINIRLIEFPSVKASLQEDCKNAASVTSDLLQKQVQNLLEQDRPDCLVADNMFPWATEVAAKFEIPRLVFHGYGFFPLCVYNNLVAYEPYKSVESDTDAFIMPNLPHMIEMTRQQVPNYLKDGSEIKLMEQILKSELASYGIVVNSFHELEPAYSEHYTKVMGRKAWQVGPVSLCNRDTVDKAERGQKASISEHECLNWLDSKGTNSVLYICFGTQSRFSAAQLMEIARALEDSGRDFIWVVNRKKRSEDEDEDEKETWLPEGFEERNKERVLIIRGWAPQLLILDHEAVGGFLTHCGWNSLLEGVAAGVPMVTWPLFAEQFCNEKLVTEILRIGVAVGAQMWSTSSEEYKVSVERKDIEKAVNELMDGEETKEMRSRARELGNMAKNAVEEVGSSYSKLNSLLEELRLNRH